MLENTWLGRKAKVISALLRLPQIKRRQVYGLGFGILLLAAFVVGGITIPAASAAGKDGTPTSMRVNGQDSKLRKDLVSVTAISGATISGKRIDGTGVSVLTTASTIYTKDGASADLSAVTVGATIGVVESVNSDGSLSAKEVLVGVVTPGSGDKDTKPQPGDETAGIIASIEGTTVTIQADNGSVTVHTSATTTFGDKAAGRTITLHDLKRGNRVYVDGKRASDGSFDAAIVMLIPLQLPTGREDAHSK